MTEADQSRLRGMALRLQWMCIYGELTQMLYSGYETKPLENGLRAHRFILKPAGPVTISPQADAFLKQCTRGASTLSRGQVDNARNAARALVESHSDRGRA